MRKQVGEQVGKQVGKQASGQARKEGGAKHEQVGTSTFLQSSRRETQFELHNGSDHKHFSMHISSQPTILILQLQLTTQSIDWTSRT